MLRKSVPSAVPDIIILILPMTMMRFMFITASQVCSSRIEDENITTIPRPVGYESQVFYRSTDRKAPHNVYTTGEMLRAGLEVTGLSEIIRRIFNHIYSLIVTILH